MGGRQIDTGKVSPGLPIEAQQHLEKAYAHKERGELEDALRECDLAIQFAPGCSEAYNLRDILGRSKRNDTGRSVGYPVSGTGNSEALKSMECLVGGIKK